MWCTGADQADLPVPVRLRWAVLWFPLSTGWSGTIWRRGLVHRVWNASVQSCRVRHCDFGVCVAGSLGLWAVAGFLRTSAEW